MSLIRVEFINPFVSAVSKTFETMVNIKVTRSAPVLKENLRTLYPVSGIIGLSGSIVGTVILTMSEPLALKAASLMLMDEMQTVNDDVLDAIGELTNMVAGNAKAQLEEYKLSLSLPNVIFGTDMEIYFPEQSQPITIPFSTEFGPFAIDVGFSDRKE
ncbi:MAG: chemotaxis protein CheX [Planctomycetaceae bacterium]|nr:chemotaxis protein CheX [Planctomycetaceae bacterium]